MRDPDASNVERVQGRDSLGHLLLADETEVGAAHDGMEPCRAGLLADVDQDVYQTCVGAAEHDEQAVRGVDDDGLIIADRIDDERA